MTVRSLLVRSLLLRSARDSGHPRRASKRRSAGIAASMGMAWCWPAQAHPGGHAHMSWLELARHYAEPDHLAFLALTVIVGWLAFRWGRRIEARAQGRASERERERP